MLGFLYFSNRTDAICFYREVYAGRPLTGSFYACG